MSKMKQGRELANKFILRESYMDKEYYEDAIKERIYIFKQLYPKNVIEVKKNKQGARVIVYENYYN